MDLNETLAKNIPFLLTLLTLSIGTACYCLTRGVDGLVLI